MARERILVIGGAGYIGKAIVKELERKFDVEVFDKKFGDDLMDKMSLEKVREFDFVVNLASVVKSFNKKKYKNNVIGLKNLIWVLSDGKTKLIYFSTQNVNLKEKGPYGLSKLACERILKKSDIDWMIVRPNYVYETGKKNYFFKMASLTKRFGFVFIIGSGENKIQPVLREDLAKVVIRLVENFKSKKIVEVSGGETYNLNEIAKMIGKNLNKKVRKIHVPVSLVKLFGFLIWFDVSGSNEDRISKIPYKYNFSSFRENLKKIVGIVKEES